MTHCSALSRRLGALLLVLLLACSSDDTPSRSSSEPAVAPIQLGLLVPASGSWARGLSWHRAAQMAVDEINASGGVLGHPLSLSVLDTETVSAVAVEGARRLVGEGVVAVIGPGTSSATIEVAQQVLIPAGIPMITPSATSPVVAGIEDSGLVWRTVASDEFQGRLAADWAFDQGHRIASILHIDNAYGIGLAEAFAGQFESLGAQVLGTVPYPDLSANDIVTHDYAFDVLPALAGVPDLIYLISYETDGAKISVAMDRFVDFRSRPSILGCDANTSQTFIDNAAPEVIAGMVGTVAAPAADHAPYQDFQERFTGRYYFSPAAYDESTYDAVYLIALAILEAGSAEPRQIADHIASVASGGTSVSAAQLDLARSLLAEGGDIDYTGASGEVDFDERGDILSGTYQIQQVVRGSFSVTETVTFP
ncbi:MAG: ABC transporter substrate-binding protein [Gemmatimonadetes bacterium]|nr:ABC transporter substrate-binding protein [Gemmatimonadota bacterium]MBT7863699.1 ABC transporter substrate-binding protein [Gemmatimonadota bacterium]